MEQHVIDAKRRDEALAVDRQRRVDGRGDETCRRLEQLQLEAIGIRPHAEAPAPRMPGKPAASSALAIPARLYIFASMQ